MIDLTVFPRDAVTQWGPGQPVVVGLATQHFKPPGTPSQGLSGWLSGQLLLCNYLALPAARDVGGSAGSAGAAGGGELMA
jgi:hypothetical protein